MKDQYKSCMCHWFKDNVDNSSKKTAVNIFATYLMEQFWFTIFESRNIFVISSVDKDTMADFFWPPYVMNYRRFRMTPAWNKVHNDKMKKRLVSS